MMKAKKRGINISQYNISADFRKRLEAYQADRQKDGVKGNGLGRCLATLAEIGYKRYEQNPSAYRPDKISEAADRGINAGKVSEDLYGKIVSVRNEIKSSGGQDSRFTIDRIFIMLAEIGLNGLHV